MTATTQKTASPRRNSKTEHVAEWLYNGIWLLLVELFRVPKTPPTLPVSPTAGAADSFKPAPGFMRYLKFKFWFFLVVIDLSILIGWIILLIVVPIAGLLLAIPALLIAVVPDIFAFVAIHLRYDTTWYVISDRSMRLRRGIWIIHETTITFENIQNLKIQQGPVQRYFGISDLIVETAGGGASSHSDSTDRSLLIANRGIFEGVANTDQLQARILKRLRAVKSTGLGDSEGESRTLRLAPRNTNGIAWCRDHIRVLHEIRENISTLRQRWIQAGTEH